MIDYEVKIFNRVHERVSPLCANKKFVSTVITEKLTALPAGCMYEMDNRTVRKAQSSTPVENRARITYQLEFYAGSKSECRKVYSAADEEMIAMNFSRMSGQYINIPDNTKVFRYVARYEAEIDQNGNIYRIP